MTATTVSPASMERMVTKDGSVGPEATTERITLRELRECAFRALVASGAQPGEASGMAEQVLEAELTDGAGLRGLAAELSSLGPSGRWPVVGAYCSREADGSLLIDGRGRRGALQLGPLLIDLVAGDTEPATAVAEGDDRAPSPLWDAALLRAAAVTRRPLAVFSVGDGAAFARVGLPTGGVARGAVLEASSLTGAARTRLVVTSGPISLTDAAESTAAQRSARRAHTARHGLLVDATAWEACREVALRYLVPSR